MNEREEFEARFPIPEGAYWGECVQQYCAGELADSFACNYWMLWECWQAARAKPVVPDGWKMVPVEPTEAIRDAMYMSGYEAADSLLNCTYKAMLAAAPKQEGV